MPLFKNWLNSFLKNLRTIIVSVVISVILWFAISIQVFPNVYSHIYDIPIAANLPQEMIDDNLQLAEPYDGTVSIQIQGKRYVIGNLTADNFSAYLDFSSVSGTGEQTVDIVVEKHDADCEIVSENLTAVVNIRRIISKTIEVTPNVDSIQVSENMTVMEDDLSCSPNTVTITGDEAAVNSIVRAEAAAIFDGTMERSTEVRGQLQLFNSDGSLIENPDVTVDAEAFTVSVPLYKVKTLPLDVSLNYPANFDASNLQYSILPAEITIASPDDSIDSLDKITIGEISVNDLTSKDLEGVRLTISLPDGYKNISNIYSAQVNFQDVDSYGKLEFSVPQENFTILNADTAYDISILTNQLPVSVVGPSEVIHNMTASDIYATANLIGVKIDEGVKSVSVSFRIAGQNMTAWVSGDYKIDILVTEHIDDIEAEDEEAATTG